MFSVNVMRPILGMDLDNDFQRIKPGDYARALDVRSVTSNGQTSHTVEDIKGNKHIFTLPTVVRQNKIMRVFLSVDVDTTITLTIRDSNGLVATAIAVTTTVIATGLANLSTAILTALGATGNTVTTTSVTIDSTSGYVETEITTILGKEWSITGVYGTGDDVTIVTTQEAIDTSIAGGLKIIGGRDLLGDLFIYSTSQSNLPSQVDITFVGQSGTLFLITTLTPHGAQTGDEVTVQGAESAPNILSNANGTWIINVLSPTIFELLGSVYDLNATGGTVTIDGHGLGEIGVSQFDFVTNTTTYTTLIRSKKFNFNTLKQIDCTHKKTNVQFDLKWVDDYNVPRVLYYQGAFVTNGAITIINPQGLYSYDTLEEETRLFVKIPSIQINFTQQYQAGGAIQSGNWRYAVRLLTESLTTSEPTKMTNPVNVYTADFNGDPEIITGNSPQVVTPKINELTITGIPIGVFKFIELIGVNYVGSSMVGYVIRRDVVGDSDTQVLRHTGTEILQDFDLGQLNFKAAAYNTFKNIDRIENRLVLSNGTSPLERDMSAWARLIKYRIKTKEISSTGTVINIQAGEYEDFFNVNRFVGYMDNETYRIGIELQYRDTGVWSSAFHAFDVTIDRNNATPDGQRLQGLNAWNLTTQESETPNPLVRYLEGTNLDYDFVLSDGRLVRDVFSAVRFVRAECIEEVLATGMTHLGIFNPVNNFQGVQPYPSYSATPAAYPTINIPTSDVGTQQFITETRQRFGFFYSPDIFFGNRTISLVSSMKLNVLGQMDNQTGVAFYIPSPAPAFFNRNEFVPMNGYLGVFNFAINYNQFDIDALIPLTKGTTATLAGTPVTLHNETNNVNGDWFWRDQSCIALHTTADINQQFSVPIKGIYYTQIFRALTDKYGDARLTKYIGTGHYASIEESSSATDTHDIFGGDTFIQKTYFHQRYWEQGSTVREGYGGGYSFYSQNRMNTQMRGGTTGVFPISQESVAYPSNVGNWLFDLNDEQFLYDFGYNIRNDIQIDAAFDSTQTQQTDLPTIIIYSETHPENSLVDMERIFLLLNFRYADNIYGEIFHHQNINGELMVWQAEAYSNMLFNTTAYVSTQDGSEVITGTGAVMSLPQRVLSTYGCQNKWSVVKWLSNGGKDLVGWIDKKNKALMRFGYDGTVPIFERHNIKSFLANNLTDPPDTPAHGEGISAVYHQRYGDVIWTIRNSTKISNQEYSFCWNEIENKFKSFYTAKPKIALSWYNFYVAPDPLNEQNIYQADAGNYLEFFGVQNDGYIEMIFHSAGGKNGVDENVIKRDLAFYVNSEIRPYKVEYETKQFKTVNYPLDPDVEQNVDDWYLPIKQDILTSSTGLANDEDTSDIYGNYLLIRFWFQGGAYQKLVAAVIKFSADARVYVK